MTDALVPVRNPAGTLGGLTAAIGEAARDIGIYGTGSISTHMKTDGLVGVTCPSSPLGRYISGTLPHPQSGTAVVEQSVNKSFGWSAAICAEQLFVSTFALVNAPVRHFVPNITSQTGEGFDIIRRMMSFWRNQKFKADAKFSALTENVDVEDDEDFRSSLIDFLHRYGEVGVRVIADRLLREGVQSELRHVFFVEMAKLDDAETLTARRSFLTQALRSTDASVRYSAAVALGLLRSDSVAQNALRDQVRKEINRAVRKMMSAQIA